MGKTYEYSPLMKTLFGYPEPCPDAVAHAYGYALLCIAGADGIVSPPEMEWLTNFYAYVMGATEDLVQSWKAFDYKNADLEEILIKLQGIPVNFKKALLYDAIRMSSADQVYDSKERKAVFKAAEIFGIDKVTVATLECLVEYELTLRKQVALLLEVPTAEKFANI